jgi:hypothetical protein
LAWRLLSSCTQAVQLALADTESMSLQKSPHRFGLPITAVRPPRLPTNALAGLAVAGLALTLAGCGSRAAPQLVSATARQPSSPGKVIYVVNIPPGLIPVEVAHNRTGRPIALPSDSTAVEVAPDRRTAFVLAGASLLPIDLATGARGRPIAVPAGSSAFAIAPSGHTAYLLHDRALVPVDLRSGAIGRPIAVPELSTVHIVIAASGRVACLVGTTVTASGNLEHQAIEPVDLVTGKAGKLIIVPGLLDVVIAPDSRTAYATTGNALEQVDLATGAIGRRIRVPMMLGIGAIAITGDGRTAYLGSLKPENRAAGVVVPIDLVTFTAERPIRVPSYPYSITDIVMAQNGRAAYVAAYSAVIPIDLPSRRVGKPVLMPAGIQAITLAP